MLPNDRFPNDDDPPTDRPVPDRFPPVNDGHDPQGETERQDNLALLAVGEPVPPEFAQHQAGCRQCQLELAAFVATVRLGREVGARRNYADAHPPASVWARIAEELAGELGSVPASEPAPVSRSIADGFRTEIEVGPVAGTGFRNRVGEHRGPRLPRWTGRTRLGLVAAGIVLAMVGAVGGYVAGHSTRASSVHVASDARLTAVPGGPQRVLGTASVRSATQGRQVVVSTTGLPLRDGFYEVWLFDPDRGPKGDMVAVGTLGDRGQGTFTLPGGIDIRAYHVVNVSAQNYGGGSRIVHAQSVLQGSLTQ